MAKGDTIDPIVPTGCIGVFFFWISAAVAAVWIFSRLV
jgi:hypothetical protein